ncbi:MAG: Uma2 family endonuclease, partial [Saprospiraceae bacterium]|nr:Uma2 family endonuclease [Saprospiraceae bacterium]
MVNIAIDSEEAILELEQENPLEQMVRSGAVSFWSGMPREHFHRFLLRNPDFKIERDKHGYITIHPPMTYDSSFYEGIAFTLLSNWSLKNRKLGLAFSPSAAFDLPDGSTHKADGAWISIEKHKRMTEEERKKIAAIVPDFVMEVRSQTDRISKLKKKMEDTWIANGVRLAWLIDPIKEKAWVYRQDGTKEEIENFS